MNKDQTLFAFYGTLRNGEGNWKWALKDRATYLKTVTIKGYLMFTFGGYPICIPVEDQTKEITIDLFENKDANSIERIDRMEIGAGYIHDMVEIEGQKYLMYVGRPDYYTSERLMNTATQVHGGDWVKHINSPKTKHESLC